MPYWMQRRLRFRPDYHMKRKVALRAITVLGLAGMLFSGFLTYLEYFKPKDVFCPVFGAPGAILGYPPCLYGLLLYSVVVAVAIAGLSSTEKQS